MSDHKPTSRWWSRMVSRENAKQLSTHVGGAAVVLGGALQTIPNPWAQIAGLVLIGLGGTGIGHDAGQ